MLQVDDVCNGVRNAKYAANVRHNPTEDPFRRAAQVGFKRLPYNKISLILDRWI